MRINQFQIKTTYSNNVNFNLTLRRPYSTSSSSKVDTPIPILTITDLQDKDSIFSKRDQFLFLGYFHIPKKDTL